MRSKAKAVVVGGGVVGVSTLYHLAKKGWADSVLIERKELTSGSTWHAAGLLPLFNMSYSVGKLHQYSVRFYREIQEETGQDVGFKNVSNIRLATCGQRMEEYKYYAGVARTVGAAVRFLSPEEVKEVWPLCNTEGLVGAIQHPEDGYIQPADLTQALAAGARSRGAEIYRGTTVTGFTRSKKEWVVHTDQGDIRCEHIVSCTGNFARRTGAMAGLDLPVMPVEHQYIVTEPHPDILARRERGLPEQGVLRESDSSWYLREENGGLLLGPYEQGAPCCYVDGPKDESEYELFNADLDRLMPHVETCIHRVPAFGEVGIKTIYNGAIAYTPDGSPIVGPAWGLPNFWLNEGHSFGITAAGGAGWQLAEWMADGEPTVDMMGVDPRRFGPYAGRGYLKQKCEEAYANVFTIHYPDEERSAARPLKTAPCYSRMQALGAVFGSVYGWERPNWFAPEGYELSPAELGQADTLLNKNYSTPQTSGPHAGRIVEKYSFRRSNYFKFVGEECRHVAAQVGLLDMSAFAKFSVTGSGAESWLNCLVANKVPQQTGRIALCHLLTASGGVRSEFTLYKRGEEDYYLVSAGAFERHDYDCLRRHLPKDGSVRLAQITAQRGVFVIAGPRARDVLQEVTDADLGNGHFPWLTAQPINVGRAEVDALRVNFVGELGWELHHPIEMQNYLFDLLLEKGAKHDLKPFGIRAMDSLRLEKSYRLIPRELSIEYSALESGLERFVKLSKGDFIGRESLLRRRKGGLRHQFVTLEVEGASGSKESEADARGSEAIYAEGEVVGRATSGGFGFRTGKSLALALLAPAFAATGTRLEIEILGEKRPCVVIPESPYDPDNKALKG